MTPHSTWSIFAYVNYHLQSFLSLLSIDGCPAMAGISFMLINVRVGLGWDVAPHSVDHLTINSSFGDLPTFRVVDSFSQRSLVTESAPYSPGRESSRYSRSTSVAVQSATRSAFENSSTPASSVMKMLTPGHTPRTPRFAFNRDKDKEEKLESVWLT